MITKILFFGFLGLNSIGNYVNAQFNNHHQQFFFLDIDDDDDDRSITTKALTPVEKKWAFASTLKNPGFKKKFINSLLVKLGKNKKSDPFPFEWGKEYSVDRNNGPWSIDVFDVVYESATKEYILCGRVIDEGNDRSEGFLLRVDKKGVFKKAKTYKKVSVFKSCVPWHNKEGFVAVGQTQDRTDSGGEPDAVYISVEKDLESGLCGLRTTGSFFSDRRSRRDLQNVPIRSGFNKVIRYKVGNKKRYAVVGETAVFPNDSCNRNSCVLVMIADSMCRENNMVTNQYGNNFDPNEPEERGLSIAQYDTDKGGLVITGNTKKVSDCKNIRFDNVLTFKVDDDLSLDWMRHHSVGYTDMKDVSDIGTAVQVDTNRNSILVAGETQTSYFGQQTTKDAFVLSLQKKNGKVQVTDVFGSYSGVSNGALFPGNLDLHLSSDNHAVVMGNTELPTPLAQRALQPPIIEVSPIVPFKYPYLIERYVTIEDQCLDKRYDLGNNRYTLPDEESITESFKTDVKKLKIEEEDLILNQSVMCPKVDPPPPTPAPLPDDFVIVTPAPFPDDFVIVTPAPIPTFAPFPEVIIVLP